MDTTHTTQTSIIQFPATTRPEGATPARVGWVDGSGPWYLKKAEGSLKIEDGDRCAIDLPHHTPGQIAALLDGQAVPLDTLSIRDGQINANDIEAIASAKPRHLALGHERGEKGFCQTAVSFVDGAHLSNLRLTILTLSGIPFTDELLDTVGAPIALGSLTTDTTGVSLKAIARFRALQILHAAGTAIESESLGSIESLVSLSSIGIRNTDLTNDHLPFLASFPRLQVLDLAYNDSLGPDLSGLSRDRNLAYLDVSGTGADSTTIETLAANKRLATLNMQCAEVTDTGLGALSSLPNITSLNLAGTHITDDGLHTIVEALPNLRSLDIRATNVTPEGAKVLSELKGLWRLGLSDPLLTVDYVTHMREIGSVTELVMGVGLWEMTDEQSAAFEVIECGTFLGRPQ